MLKKTITYVDYNGESRTEDFYFNLSKAELTLMEASKAGGLKNYMERIIQAKDITAIAEMFKDIIHMSYGEKSPDGKRFIKSDELSTAFEQTEAYSELVMELLDVNHAAENAAKFLNGVLPKDLGVEVTPDMAMQVLNPA